MNDTRSGKEYFAETQTEHKQVKVLVIVQPNGRPNKWTVMIKQEYALSENTAMFRSERFYDTARVTELHIVRVRGSVGVSRPPF